MRDILFRAKSKETSEWVYGTYIMLHRTTYAFAEDYEKHPDNDQPTILFERMTDWGLPNLLYRGDVDPETVGQFTGILDETGKRIYEGDIINVDGCMGTRRAIVRFGEYGQDASGGEYSPRVCLGFYLETVAYRDYWEWYKGCLDYCIERYSIVKDDLYNMEYRVIGNVHDNPELLHEWEDCGE